MENEACERVYAEVSLDAVRSNAERMKENLPAGTKMIAVVKADGYGHGAVPVAKELEGAGCADGFAVATAREAFSLKEAGITGPILILGYCFPCDYERAIEEEIRITVFRRDTLRELSEIYEQNLKKGLCRKARVHIKVDTGMSRIGVWPDESGISFVEEAFAAAGVEVEGIFTHFARADEADKTNAEGQLSLFRAFLSRIKEKTGRTIPVRHCANSAGLMELPGAGLDAVRAGIALYGLWPSEQVRKDVIPLAPALSLYTRIVFIKEIEAGCAVSYGGAFTAGEKMRIATIPVGYADGYARGLSGKGYVLIHGKKAGILGRICMDQFMVDVTHIPEAKEGDRVTLIGRDGREEITMELLGGLSGRFNYEFACCLGSRVPRYYKKGGLVCRREQQNF